MSLRTIIDALDIAIAANYEARRLLDARIEAHREKGIALGSESIELRDEAEKILSHRESLARLDAEFIDAIMPPTAIILPELTPEQEADLMAKIQEHRPQIQVGFADEAPGYVAPSRLFNLIQEYGGIANFTAVHGSQESGVNMVTRHIRCGSTPHEIYYDDDTLEFKDAWTTARKLTIGRVVENVMAADRAKESQPDVAAAVPLPVETMKAELDAQAASDLFLATAPIEEVVQAIEDKYSDPAELPEAADPEPEAPSVNPELVKDTEAARKEFREKVKVIQDRFTEEAGKIVLREARARMVITSGSTANVPPDQREKFLEVMDQVANERAEHHAAEDFKDAVAEIAEAFPHALTRASSMKRAVYKTHVAAQRPIDIPARLRPEFLQHFRAELDGLKATAHPLPDVTPELPEMTAQDQDVLLIMRSECNASGICTHNANDIARLANVTRAAVEGDIIPRLEKLGKLSRTKPAFPARWRVAASDASFPRDTPPAANPFPIPQTASALLARGSRSTRGKVFGTLMHSRKDGFSSFQVSKLARDLQLKLPQVKDALDQLVQEGTIKLHPGHAPTWSKAQFLRDAPAA